MSEALIAIRNVYREECPWLRTPICRGDILYAFTGCTYGCIGNGRAVTESSGGEPPFFELPKDSVMPAVAAPEMVELISEIEEKIQDGNDFELIGDARALLSKIKGEGQ